MKLYEIIQGDGGNDVAAKIQDDLHVDSNGDTHLSRDSKTTSSFKNKKKRRDPNKHYISGRFL